VEGRGDNEAAQVVNSPEYEKHKPSRAVKHKQTHVAYNIYRPIIYIGLYYQYCKKQQYAKIEYSLVCDTSSMAELIYDIINRQFLSRKCPKPVKIQLLPTALASGKYQTILRGCTSCSAQTSPSFVVE